MGRVSSSFLFQGGLKIGISIERVRSGSYAPSGGWALRNMHLSSVQEEKTGGAGRNPPHFIAIASSR
jgi:hypothetical protein